MQRTRRDLLATASGTAAVWLAGCTYGGGDGSGDAPPTGTPTPAREVDGERTPRHDDPQEYREAADRLPFETLRLGDCTHSEDGEGALPGSICSDDPLPLVKRGGDDGDLYGFLLVTDHDGGQVDGGALDDREVVGGSAAGSYDRPSAFLTDTSFDSELVALVQAHVPSTPASLRVEAVGELPGGELWVETSQSGGRQDAPAHLSTLVRVADGYDPSGIVVGYTYDGGVGGDTSRGVYGSAR